VFWGDAIVVDVRILAPDKEPGVLHFEQPEECTELSACCVDVGNGGVSEHAATEYLSRESEGSKS
jgi:hypothetical protein